MEESQIAVELGEHVNEYLAGNEDSFRQKVAELQQAGVPSGAIAHALQRYYNLRISKVALQRMAGVGA